VNKIHVPASKPFPPVSRALLEALEQLFPDRAPGRTDTEADIRYKAGAVSVIRFLRAQYDHQNQES